MQPFPTEAPQAADGLSEPTASSPGQLNPQDQSQAQGSEKSHGQEQSQGYGQEHSQGYGQEQSQGQGGAGTGAGQATVTKDQAAHFLRVLQQHCQAQQSALGYLANQVRVRVQGQVKS